MAEGAAAKLSLGWLELSLNVKDVERSRAFYEAFDFKLVETNDKGMSATLQAENCRLALYQGVLGPAENQLIFWQGDVEEIVAALERDGVEFVQPLKTNDKGAASFMLRDPDGQLIYVIREKDVVRSKPAPAAPDLDRGFFQASLPVKSIDISAAYYARLGFAFAQRNGDTNATITDGHCRIGLYGFPLDPNRLQLMFWQGDIDAVVEVVRRNSFDFYGAPKQDDEGRSVMVRDPDDNPLFFINMEKYKNTGFSRAHRHANAAAGQAG